MRVVHERICFFMPVEPYRPRKPRVSAGLLMYRLRQGEVEVFIAHPGGPWFPNRDYDVWTIPKGELEPGEAPFEAALREFEEEVGIKPSGPYMELGSIRQKGGKTVWAWGFEGNWDLTTPLKSTSFNLEWPIGSGVVQNFPEIDRVGFFRIHEARARLKLTQHPLLDRLIRELVVLGKVEPGETLVD